MFINHDGSTKLRHDGSTKLRHKESVKRSDNGDRGVYMGSWELPRTSDNLQFLMKSPLLKDGNPHRDVGDHLLLIYTFGNALGPDM